MSAFTIKGITIGSGTPKTIVSLMGHDARELSREARAAIEAGAQCLEWRVDYLPDLDNTSELCACARTLKELTASNPLIATVRTTSQGGRADLDAIRYESLVRILIDDGAADLIDLELCFGTDVVGSLANRAHAKGQRIICSHHDFEGTPSIDEMCALLELMPPLGADILKLAVYARNAEDACRLMLATARVDKVTEAPLLTIAMGAQGAITRLAGEAFGSAMTFSALERSSAPGQVPLAAARSAINALHEALTVDS